MKQSDIARSILEKAQGMVKLQVFKDSGVSPETLRRMVEAGIVERPASGHYALAGRIDIMDIDWVAFSVQVPGGVIGLLSAAVHHGMTQEVPPYLQAFVPRTKTWGRFRLGGDSGAIVDLVSSRREEHFELEVIEVLRSGYPVKVTSPERTLVDLFMFSPFYSGTTERTARIPEETFLESLGRCVDNEAFSFQTLHDIAVELGCDEQIGVFTKTARYAGLRSPGM